MNNRKTLVAVHRRTDWLTTRVVVTQASAGGTSRLSVIGKEGMAEGAAGRTLNIDTEESLIGKIRLRDQGALAEIFDRFASIVYSVALRVLREPSAAEEVMHEIFLDVWQNPDAYSAPSGSLCLRLVLVARNRAIYKLRPREPMERIDEIAPVSRLNLDVLAERECRLQGIRESLKALPAIQQQMLELAFFEGMTLVEIAASRGESLTAVKACICSVMLSLRCVDGAPASRNNAAIVSTPRALAVQTAKP